MKLLVIGAGGHAKVVLETALAQGWEIAGVVDELSPSGGRLLGYATVLDWIGVECDGFVVAIGDNATRAERFAALAASGLEPATVVHPSAAISPSAELGAGTVVFGGVIVNAEARVGRNCILNTGCTVDHDCELGDHVHVGPGSNLCGNVSAGEGALLGVGSCLSPGTSVGAWTTVGAGATVVDDLPANSVCVGTPARAIRTLG